jgi:acetyltransferase
MSEALDPALLPFFNPTGIVVVGVSTQPNKLGYGLARNLVSCEFPGPINFVNHKGGDLFGQQIIKNITDVPGPVDLALLMIPAKFVPRVLSECGQRGIKAVIILSGGFSETGKEGALLEDECIRIAADYDIRLMGPNCIGLIDTHLPLDTTFLPPPIPVPGEVSFISQSGALCAAIIDWARGQGFSFSRLVSLGNQIDVSEADVLSHVAEDKFTRVITLYLEGIENGRYFIDEASRVTRQKPIIVLKAGRSEEGQRAVTSHTGAMAGREIAFDAACRKAGIIRAKTIEEMFDWARALAWCPLPKGRKVAVLTNAGGPGVIGVDALEWSGLSIAVLSDKTKKTLKEILPSAASTSNPIDMLASASPAQYAQSLETLLKDGGVDSVMVVLPPPPMFAAEAIAIAIIPIIQSSGKPVVVALMGDRLIPEAVGRFRTAGIPDYRFPERVASALAVLSHRAEWLARMDQIQIMKHNVNKKGVGKILKLNQKFEDGFLPEMITADILKTYGMPLLSIRLAETPLEAIRIADEIGYPLVLKVASPEISHKSDIGGVILNLSSPNEIERGFEEIHKLFMEREGIGSIHGVYVQKMVEEGQEVIIGTIQDPQFGPLVMFGSGGVEVEGIDDVAFSLAPITNADIQFLFNSTWVGKKLKGYREFTRS